MKQQQQQQQTIEKNKKKWITPTVETISTDDIESGYYPDNSEAFHRVGPYTFAYGHS